MMTPLSRPKAVPTPPEQADLLRAVASADRSAFACLYGYYAPRVKAFLMRSGMSPGQAEELAQDTMISVWRKAGTFDPAKAGVSTWIYTIARNLRIDQLRRNTETSVSMGEATQDDSDLECVDASPSLLDQLAASQLQAEVREALAALPPEQQEILRLSFFEEKPHAAIAASLSLPLGTVKSRIRLAIGHLRQKLGHLTS